MKASAMLDEEEVILQHSRLVSTIIFRYLDVRKCQQKYMIDLEDLLQVGKIGLLKAYRTYRPELGKWSTYAGRCITNEIFMLLRACKRREQSYEYMLSLHEPLKNDMETVSVEDIIADARNDVDEFVDLDFLEAVLKELWRRGSPSEKKLLKARIEFPHAKQADLAEIVGCKQSHISRTLKNLRAKKAILAKKLMR